MKRFLLVAILLCLPSVGLGVVRNVADFGAIPDDGRDDRQAIASAINALASGDVLGFGDGTYDISANITTARSNFTLLGTTRTVFRGVGAEGDILKVQGDGVKLYGITFRGGGVFVEKPGGGRNDRFVVDFCRFLMDVPAGRIHRSAITFTSGLNNSSITNTYFTGRNGGWAIYGYNYNGLTIANNEVVDCNTGFHIDAFGNSGNLLVEQNHMTGIKDMAFEFQSTASNLVFQDNWVEDPMFVTDPGTGGSSTFAYSLILDKSSNITIRRNVHISPRKPSSGGDYVRIVFEVGGDNTLVEDNYSDGGNHILAMNDGVGSASVTVRNNLFKNYAQGISNSFPSSTRTLTATNNGPNVVLSDTMRARLAAGQRPGIGAKRYGTTAPPVVPPTVLTSPADGFAFIAGSTVTASGTGQGLRWSVDRTNDGQIEIATGTGPSIDIPVPANSDPSRHQIRITLTGDNGQVTRHYPIALPTDQPATQPGTQPSTNPAEIDLLLARVAELERTLAEVGAALSAARLDLAAEQEKNAALAVIADRLAADKAMLEAERGALLAKIAAAKEALE